MRKAAVILFALILASGLSFALFANIMEPVTKTLYSTNSVRLGNAGPGQTIYLIVDRGTDGGRPEQLLRGRVGHGCRIQAPGRLGS